MPIGYSDDVRLRELTKAAKVKLDILTAKLGNVKREFEQAEKEYGDLVVQAQRLGNLGDDVYPPKVDAPGLSGSKKLKREDN